MTDPAILLPFLTFAILMTGTPGPNNTMILTAGARAGFWPAMPLILGIAAGVAILMLAVGLGLGTIFSRYPALHTVLQVLGTLYLLWLAYKIATSGPISGTDERSPLGFFGGAVFQWINPKSWAITTSAASAYLPVENYTANLGIAALILAIIAVPCMSVWAGFGAALRQWLSQPRYATIFNLTVAALLVLATIPILLTKHS